MKLLFAIFCLAFSVHSFAKENIRPEVCYSTGECVNKFGVHAQDVCFTTCDSRQYCISLPLSSTCVKVSDQIYGVCKTEVVENTKCVNAEDLP